MVNSNGKPLSGHLIYRIGCITVSLCIPWEKIEWIKVTSDAYDVSQKVIVSTVIITTINISAVKQGSPVTHLQRFYFFGFYTCYVEILKFGFIQFFCKVHKRFDSNKVFGAIEIAR